MIQGYTANDDAQERAHETKAGTPMELAVLSLSRSAARCRRIGGDQTMTLRSSGLWNLVPGMIVVVKPRKLWSYAGHPYISGEVESHRIDADALGLTPLRLEERGTWNPETEYWGPEGAPVEAWAKPIIARGPRPAYEMEQVVPGTDPNDPDSDPIGQAMDAINGGDGNAGCAALELPR